jgi:hypothetical protein
MSNIKSKNPPSKRNFKYFDLELTGEDGSTLTLLNPSETFSLSSILECLL